MFMAMEAPALVERKDMAYGLILLRISISTIFFGQILRSCMYDAIYLNPTCHIWLLQHFQPHGEKLQNIGHLANATTGRLDG